MQHLVEEAFRNIEAPEVLEAVQQPVGGGRIAARLELPEPDEPRHAGVRRVFEQMLEVAPKPGRDPLGDAVVYQPRTPDLAEQAGIGRDRMYFNIARVGNTSAASIPLAIHDAVREGMLSAPTRVFTPGFGAGAVAGYAVLRIDPAVVAPESTGPPTPMDAGPLLALPHTASSADVEAAFGG